MSNPYPTRLLRDVPVIFLQMNDAVGSATAADSSGNANHGGTITGDTFGSTGVLNADPQHSVLLDGTGGMLIPEAASTVLVNTATIKMTVRYASTPADNTRFAEHGNGAFLSVGVGGTGGGTSGHLMVLFYDGASNKIADSGVAASTLVNKLVEVIATVDGGAAKQLKIYVNGVLKATTTIAAGFTYAPADAITTIGQNTAGGRKYTGNLSNFALFNTVLSAATIAAQYAAGAYCLNLPRQQPWAGNVNIARRYRDCGSNGNSMRLLAIGDSIMANLQGALQRSLKPGKWVGFIGTQSVSTSQGNLGIGLATVSSSAGTISTSGNALTIFTANGSAAPDGGSVGDTGCVFARVDFSTPDRWAQAMSAGDFIFEALARGVQPVVESLILKTAGGGDGTFFFAYVPNNVQETRVPAVSGYVTASGTGYSKVTLTLPLDANATPGISNLVGYRLDNSGTGVNGKTLTIGNHFHLSTGEAGFEFGSIAVGGTTATQWAGADGIYPDAYLQALSTNYGVTDYLVILGANDGDTNLITDIPLLFARLRSLTPGCGILLGSMYELATGWGVDRQAKQEAQLRAIAIADGNCLYLDLYHPLGPYQLNYANTGLDPADPFYDNYGIGDGEHPDDTGRVRVVERIDATLLMASYAGTFTPRQGPFRGSLGG